MLNLAAYAEVKHRAIRKKKGIERVTIFGKRKMSVLKE